MASQKNHPYPHLSPEFVFDRVIKAVGGVRVDSIVSKAVDWDNADYVLESENLIVELKELHADVSEDQELSEKVSKIYSKWAVRGVVPVVYGKRSIRIDLLPEECRREIILLFKRKVEAPVKKAARQIKATKTNLGLSNAKGLLILVNEGGSTLRPDWMFYLLHQITKGQHRSIDHVVYCSVNLPMEGGGIPDQALIWAGVKISERRPVDSDLLQRMQQAWQRVIDEEIGLGPRPVLDIDPEESAFSEMEFQKKVPNQRNYFVQSGGFYVGPTTDRKYYCDSIEGGIANMYLVESYLDGRLLQANFRQKLVHATTANYLPIKDAEELRRLKRMLKKLRHL